MLKIQVLPNLQITPNLQVTSYLQVIPNLQVTHIFQATSTIQIMLLILCCFKNKYESDCLFTTQKKQVKSDIFWSLYGGKQTNCVLFCLKKIYYLWSLYNQKRCKTQCQPTSPELKSTQNEEKRKAFHSNFNFYQNASHAARDLSEKAKK